jgi:inositol phosphorylceramide mannosyltransferase catalytic subunit
MTPLVHHLWLGGPIPEQYTQWREAMIAMNPSVKFWLWREQGVEETLGLNMEDLKYRFPTWAGISNAVRLYIVHKFSGLYFDLDYEPIKPLDEFLEYGDAVCLQEDGRACNSYFQAEQGSRWVKWQIDHLDDINHLAPYAGVDHMTKALREAPVTILPSRWVYPFNFDAPADKRALHPDTIMCHHWSGSWLKKS